MKLKLNEEGHAVLQEGKPVYVHDDGKEVAFDAPATVATISRLNGEAKHHREAKEAAEEKLKAYEGISDPEAARNAIATLKNIDDKKLVDAGKVDEIKAAATKALEDKIAALNKTHADEIQTWEKKFNDVQGTFQREKIAGMFSGSKLIKDKFAVPHDMAQARFGENFKFEPDGKVVAYDATGNKIYSRSKPGELADFDEALEVLVDQYPYRDNILKGSGSGSGAKPSEGHGDGGQKKITRTEFDALSQSDRSQRMKDGYKLVDA